MVKVGVYIRVSTKEQAKQGVSLKAQEEALRNYCKTYGYEIYKFYRDKGKSAKNIKNRPAMVNLLKDAEAKKIDAILIYKLDRFSRSLKDLILTIEQLKKLGVDFISLQDKIETTSASGKLMFHIISSFAEFERDVIGERTKFGMGKKAKDGAIVNRAPLGYKIRNKKLVVDPVGKVKVLEIFNHFLNNDISLNQLAKKYGFTIRGIKKLLTNQTYTGKVKFNNEWYKGIHESIISKEFFSKTNDKLNKITAKWKRDNIKFINLKELKNIKEDLINIFRHRFLRWEELVWLFDAISANKAIRCGYVDLPEFSKDELDKIKIRPGVGSDQHNFMKKEVVKFFKNMGFSDSEIETEYSYGERKADVVIHNDKNLIYVVEIGQCQPERIFYWLNSNIKMFFVVPYGSDKAFVYSRNQDYKYYIKNKLPKLKEKMDNIYGKGYPKLKKTERLIKNSLGISDEHFEHTYSFWSRYYASLK